MNATNCAGQGDGERIPIILLKTKSTPKDGYEEKFSTVEGLLFEPIFVPVLEHKFLDEGLNIVGELLQSRKIGKRDGAKYGGMIFTSQRAVEAFARLVEEGKGVLLNQLLRYLSSCSI